MAFADARIHALRPFPRQIDCGVLRHLLEGSQFTREATPSIQDAYTLALHPAGARRGAGCDCLLALVFDRAERGHAIIHSTPSMSKRTKSALY